jgi:hypothetical protein
MLSKMLAGLLAAAVLTVGGYAYWQYADGCTETPAPSSPCSTHESTSPPCCLEPSRSAVKAPCCCEDDDSAPSPEVLAIEPRELK